MLLQVLPVLMPIYFQKEVMSSKSTTYKCLMGCHNKIVTVFNSTLNNARRHVAVKQTFNNVLLDEFNASFTAGRQSSNVDGKSLLVATIDKPLVNFNNSPSTITPIDYIIQDTLPLSGVEKGGFVKLMSVSLTIAGNGSNFLKAFRVFGPNTNEQELSENSKDCEEEFCEEDDSFVYIDIDEILLNHEQTHFEDIENESDLSEHININENQGYKIKLPPHMRCSCHILNLIATTDVHNIGNVLFKRMFKIVDSKFKKILNKQARSYNTGLPSSAARERLFSTTSLIFTPKQCNLSDPNFGIQFFF
ncbi:hypothetical protein GHT06_003252 [Daphnia sinensis]|uniref:Uncharacterized protein n=1 Tax=Daphnia sinensis TaxID=1820382 RepID=A0AAD5KVR8_9CRUS|nr:hypothetical protein GHT06_003252 [Daphnia sinensis]